MKIRLFITALALPFALSSPCFVPVSARADLSKIAISEKTGGFSYRPPMGWTVEESSASKFRIVGAPVEQGMKFRPNLNFLVTNEKVGFDVFVTVSLKEALEATHGKEISRSRFKTNAGIQGYRVTMEAIQKGVNLRHTFYMFPVKQNRQIFVAATSLASEGDQYDDVFDECVKSLKLR